jgi:thiol:disulfide interchange protein
MKAMLTTTLSLALLTAVPSFEISASAQGPLPAPTDKFDPARDAAADIESAVVVARQSGRRIILDVGGEWCGWCHTLDRFFAADAELQKLRDTSYIWLKVNYSEENKNQKVLSRYPAIKGYPHLFVLEQDGKLLHSQDTVLLEKGSSYERARVVEFLQKWAPKKS